MQLPPNGVGPTAQLEEVAVGVKVTILLATHDATPEAFIDTVTVPLVVVMPLAYLPAPLAMFEGIPAVPLLAPLHDPFTW